MENNEERKIRSLNKITARLSSLLSTLTILLSSSLSLSLSLSLSSSLSLIILSSLSLTSCTSSLEESPIDNTGALHEVTVTLTGINFTLNPTRATVPDGSPSGITRASDATPSQAGITHIALKVFNNNGTVVASVTQTSSSAGSDFNSLHLQLPAGTYTFVAVAHSATADNIPCATITSPSEATLPEGIVPTLYSHVQLVTISNVNNQTVSLNMGKRINATLHLTSTDNVPAGVARMAVDVNSAGTEVTNTSTVSFNPTTGLAVGNWHYRRAIAVTEGHPIDGNINILLPSDQCTFTMAIHAQNASGEMISDYDRSFSDVPFQRAYVTNATGIYFRYLNSSYLTFDTTIGSQDYNL